MTSDEARAVVRATVATVAPEVDTASIGDGDAFMRDLGLDSVDFLNVIIGIHDATGITIPERDYDDIGRFGELVAYLTAAG